MAEMKRSSAMQGKRLLSLLLFFAIGMSAVPVNAISYGNGLVLRAGAGINPDQFVVGVQTVLGHVFRSPFPRFAPSADIGFGDNVTVITLNPDFRLMVSPPRSDAFIYIQAGPTIAIVEPKNGDNDTNLGLTLSGGLNFPMGASNFYSLEGRIGIGDVPDVRILLGFQFGGGK
jgi:hypothetical protein